MKNRTKEQTEQLLVEYYLGETDNDALAEEIRNWIGASAENRRTYDDIIRSATRLEWLAQSPRIDEKKAYAKVSQNWNKRRSLWKRYAVASAVAVLLVAGSFFLLPKLYIGYAPMADGARITTDPSAVTLITSAGNTIMLGAETTGSINIDGLAVTVMDDQSIVYNPQTDASPQVAEIQYNTIVVPRGRQYQLVLSDNTKVWINSESTIEYPVSFGDTREVRFSGEAYFEVAKDAKRPFMVHHGDFSVRVHGTEFNLNTFSDEALTVALAEGSVGFCNGAEADEVLIVPGQVATANTLSGESNVAEADIYLWTAWKDNDVVFNNEPLGDIMVKLSRWYDVDVTFAREELKNMRFSANLRRYDDINDLLGSLERTSAVAFLVKDRHVVVKSK